MSRKRTHKNKGIKLIKKSNQLIESRYKFDIWETRVFLSVLSNIRKSDEDFTVYRIWYKDVIKTFGLKSGQSYEYLRTAARGLMRKVFYVSDDVDGHKRETEYHIIRTVNYLAEGEKGGDNQEYLDITIDPEMKPLLLQLGQKYTAYDLRNVIKLGAYHVRIYELLKQYQTIGHRKLEIDAIKTMLEITTEYPLFGNFFQKVIKPSIKAINKHTDLTITKLEKLKTGRKVTALYFEFHQKSGSELKLARGEGIQQQLPLAPKDQGGLAPKSESERDRLFSLFHETVVKQFGVTPSTFLELLRNHTEPQVHQAVRVTRRANFNQEIKTTVSRFFVTALKKGYTDVKEEALKKKEKQEKNADLARQKESIENEREASINNKIREIVAADPELTEKVITKAKKQEHVRIIISEKEKGLGRSLNIEDYRKDPLLRALVKENIIEHNKAAFKAIFEKYDAKLSELEESWSKG